MELILIHFGIDGLGLGVFLPSVLKNSKPKIYVYHKTINKTAENLEYSLVVNALKNNKAFGVNDQINRTQISIENFFSELEQLNVINLEDKSVILIGEETVIFDKQVVKFIKNLTYEINNFDDKENLNIITYRLPWFYKKSNDLLSIEDYKQLSELLKIKDLEIVTITYFSFFSPALLSHDELKVKYELFNFQPLFFKFKKGTNNHLKNILHDEPFNIVRYFDLNTLKELFELLLQIVGYLSYKISQINLSIFIKLTSGLDFHEILVDELLVLYEINSDFIEETLRDTSNKLKDCNINVCYLLPWFLEFKTKEEFFARMQYKLKFSNHRNFQSPQLILIRWFLEVLKEEISA